MHRKSSGSALVTALFIMTLVAIVATAMNSRLRMALHRTTSVMNSDTLYLASQAVTFWAMETIKQRTTPFIARNPTNGKIRIFPKRLQTTIYPGLNVQGELYDLQAQINLNSILDKNFPALLYRLLESKPKLINSKTRKLIFNATTHWISPYSQSHDQNSFSSSYLKQNPPYYPAYQPMQSISEFRLVAGVTTPIYERLSPYLTTLPEPTRINLNTAPKTVLRCLGNGLNTFQTQEIIQLRQNNKGIDPAELQSLLLKFNIPKEQVTITSNYFLSIATITGPETQLMVYTILKLNANGLTSIIQESLNTI